MHRLRVFASPRELYLRQHECMGLGVALILLLSACSPSRSDTDKSPDQSSAPTAPETWTLSPDGLGPVRIGSTLADLDMALGDSLRTSPSEEQCHYVRPTSLPAGVLVMIEQDRIVRIDVDSSGVLTPEGIGVGTPEAEVVSRYGARAEVSPHKYTGPDGHYLTVSTPSDSSRLTIFETDGQKVLRYRVGAIPQVQYVEGCS